MPSTRLTKVNIDKYQLEELKKESARIGLSVTKLLETIIEAYLE